MMLTSVASVFLVFGVLALLLRMLRRWGGEPVSGRHIEVVETVPLAAGKCLSVVQVAGRAMLLATTNDSVTLLTELEPERIESRREQPHAAALNPGLISARRWIGRALPVVSRNT